MAKRQAPCGHSSRNSATRTRSKRRVFRLERLESRHLLAAQPIINEFVAANDGSLVDGDGNQSDWIELFNAGDRQPISKVDIQPTKPRTWKVVIPNRRQSRTR